jgi:hypothetical protein
MSVNRAMEITDPQSLATTFKWDGSTYMVAPQETKEMTLSHSGATSINNPWKNMVWSTVIYTWQPPVAPPPK